jgi:hypothetical protein
VTEEEKAARLVVPVAVPLLKRIESGAYDVSDAFLKTYACGLSDLFMVASVYGCNGDRDILPVVDPCTRQACGKTAPRPIRFKLKAITKIADRFAFGARGGRSAIFINGGSTTSRRLHFHSIVQSV